MHALPIDTDRLAHAEHLVTVKLNAGMSTPAAVFNVAASLRLSEPDRVALGRAFGVSL